MRRASRTLSGLGTLLAVGLALSAAARPARAQAAPTAPADTTILPPSEIGTLHVGQTVRGRLEPGDHTMGDGTWADVWYVEGTAGQRLVVELRSRQFDAYLILLDAAGAKIVDDDDSAGSGDARITVTLRTAGRYQIVVNNFGDTPQQGAYTLQAR